MSVDDENIFDEHVMCVRGFALCPQCLAPRHTIVAAGGESRRDRVVQYYPKVPNLNCALATSSWK